MLSYYLLRD